jgi:hypothetical protein
LGEEGNVMKFIKFETTTLFPMKIITTYCIVISLFFLLVFSTSSGQKQVSYIELTAKSKFATDVGIEYVVYYENKTFLNSEDSIFKIINLIIIDSLKQFDMFEMISTEIINANDIIESIVRNEFDAHEIEVDIVILRKVKIPEEARLLFYKYEELKQTYLESLIEIEKLKHQLEE